MLQNPRSGCFARTDIMCQMAKEASIEPMIIRTSSRDMIKAPLFFTDKDNNIEKTYANWDFHIAMAINVKDSHGNINPLVFDPAMYDGPVTTSQWKNTLGVGEQFRIIPHEEGMAVITSYSIHYTKLYDRSILGNVGRFEETIYKSTNND